MGTAKGPLPKEMITPHRLAVAILIREFCKMRESAQFSALLVVNQKLYIRDFCLLMLKLIQSPDLQFTELLDLLRSDRHVVQPSLITIFETNLLTIPKFGIECFLDIVKAVSGLTTPPEDPMSTAFVINSNSVIGYYLRRLVISFDKLNFSEVAAFFDSFKRYVLAKQEAEKANTVTYKSQKDLYVNKEKWSQRQAELFIATQAALITNNEEKALNPKDLHRHIKNLLKSNPNLSEAHFLNYLNYLRVKEFCGAMDSLYHSFDRNAFNDTKSTPEEKTKAYRYAALNLAVLHVQFGHKEEALAALKEAIRIAQETSDDVCLQHALSWLCCLTHNRGFIEHSILKSLELSLSYTMSLGIQSFVHFAGIRGGIPKQIFDTMTKSDVINCQHAHHDLISSSYAQKSSLWLFYGKTAMSSLWSQLLLHLNTESLLSSKMYFGEGYCQAVCSIANHLQQQGEYKLANSVLHFAKQKFPNEPNSHEWMLCESLFEYTVHLHHRNFIEAEIAAQKLAVIDEHESCLLMTELLLHRSDYSGAKDCIGFILNKSERNEPDLRIDIDVRAMILMAQIEIASCFPTSIPGGVLTLLNSALAYTNDYHLGYLNFMIHLYIAHVQLLMGMPRHALNLLDICLVQVLSHGGAFDRARALLLYAKCLVANSAYKSTQARRSDIVEAAEILDKVKKNFEKVEAHYRVKDVLYLQAQLYNEIEMRSERNRCALMFRVLDEEHPKAAFNAMEKFVLIITPLLQEEV